MLNLFLHLADMQEDKVLVLAVQMVKDGNKISWKQVAPALGGFRTEKSCRLR